MTNLDELGALRSENARLTALLESHGIDWHLLTKPQSKGKSAYTSLRQ